MHPFLAGLKPPVLVASRGGAKVAPENTLQAFRSAVSHHGAPMVELDLHATRDGELVVMHDATVERCTNGTGAIASMTLAEIRKLDAGMAFSPDGGRTFPFRGVGVRVPTLAEVLRALPATRVNVDLKPEDVELAPVLAGVVRGEGAVERVCVGSKHDAVALRLLAELPEGCHFFPRQALSDFVRAAMRMQEPPDNPGFQVLEVPYVLGPMKLANEAVLNAARQQGHWVIVWTVDEREQMTELLDLGVDGIMTDRPDLLREVLDGRAGTP